MKRSSKEPSPLHQALRGLSERPRSARSRGHAGGTSSPPALPESLHCQQQMRLPSRLSWSPAWHLHSKLREARGPPGVTQQEP